MPQNLSTGLTKEYERPQERFAVESRENTSKPQHQFLRPVRLITRSIVINRTNGL